MLKNSIKKVLALFMIVFLLLSINNYIYAETANMSGLIKDLDTGSNSVSGAVGKVNNVVNTVITIARVVGVAVAIVMLLVIAMKYMSAAPGEKADIKKSAVVYVVGAVVLFAVSGILGIINSFASAIS